MRPDGMPFNTTMTGGFFAPPVILFPGRENISAAIITAMEGMIATTPS